MSFGVFLLASLLQCARSTQTEVYRILNSYLYLGAFPITHHTSITRLVTPRARVKIFSGALAVSVFSCMSENAAGSRTSSSARAARHPVEVADRGDSISICDANAVKLV